MDNDREALQGSDLVLLALAAPTVVASARGRVNGITRLEKLLFLAQKEGILPATMDDPLLFKAYKFGPYSKQVYEAVELLEQLEFVREEQVLDDQTLDTLEDAEIGASEAEYVERRFFLTEDGSAVAKLLSSQHPSVVDSLSKIKDKYAGLSLRQLIRYVYTKYPESASESIIRDQVL